MKQNIIQFSALLIILLVGTAGAIENTDDLVSVTGPSVSIGYDCDFVKMGDVVTITATFSEPVVLPTATVGGTTLIPNEFDPTLDWNNYTNTDWTFDYEAPAGINGYVDVTVSGTGSQGPIGGTIFAAFAVDNEAPLFQVIEPNSDPVYTDCVLFEFGAVDRLDNTVDYTICVNGTEKKTGTITSNDYVIFDPEMADGYYQLEITLEDTAGNIATWGPSGPIDLYVDCKDPSVTLVSPANFAVITLDDPFLEFNFTAEDTVSANYNLDMNYQLYIDGEPIDILGTMKSGEYINATYPAVDLSDGVHNWSVSVEDMAENDCSGKVREFYVYFNELQVNLISPDEGYVSANPEFNFSVMGGAGLPFDYELLINGTEVKNGTFVVGEDPVNHYSVTATVKDAENIPWTVRITDCSGKVCEPIPEELYFSVDTIAPAPVANLFVADSLSETELPWLYSYDEPGLYVCWDKNTEDDLAATPYEIYISDCEPCEPLSIDNMEKAVPFSEIYEADTYMCMNISTYGGEPLVYGKNYWVAVIAKDRAGNYDECFAFCGPVQTYEDMTLMLDEGWNLKSVPKTPAAFNDDPKSVFGECTIVLYWDGSCWEFPDTIEPCKGYWVYTPEAGISNVKFKPMSVDSTSPDVPASLDLAPGWQMIGHTATVPAQWTETLGSLQIPQGLGFEYKFSNLITYSNNEGWGGTISLGLLTGAEESMTPYPVEYLRSQGLMVPGQGYWIFMKEGGTYASVESVIYMDPNAV